MYVGKFLLAFFTTLALMTLASLAFAREYDCQHRSISSRYDSQLQLAARRNLPHEYPWCLLKSLCQTESNLNADVVSPVGAVGLCQLMPGTAEEVGLRSNLRRDAKRNAEAAARYLAKLHAFWLSPRSNECRWELMASSFNAGAGNILKAQTISGGRRCWDLISPHLPEVTGHHSAETQAYVLRIWANYRLLTGAGF